MAYKYSILKFIRLDSNLESILEFVKLDSNLDSIEAKKNGIVQAKKADNFIK